MTVTEHKERAKKKTICGIITVSDTRTVDTDKSGKNIADMLAMAGHEVRDYQVIIDDGLEITTTIEQMIANQEIKAILINGGTGIAKRDVTIETLHVLFEKEMPGFGEIFRFLSYTEDIGSAAMLSRATAGIYKNRVIFAMPGSSGAVKLAMSKLILPELSHIIYELEKD